MKYATLTALAIISLLFPAKSKAQAFEDAGQYISYISKLSEDLTVTYLSYTSAVAHNKSARKQEKRRQDVVNAIIDTRASVQGMPPWKGDRSFKDTTVSYLKILGNVFNEDYAKIVNMEEIAEQSYDAMEAYLLAQEKAEQKLEEARLNQYREMKKFAAKYNVNLIEGESEISQKSKIASGLNKYYNDVYLVFFKPYKQEMYLLDAVSKGNLIAIEQNLNSLGKFADDGAQKLNKMEGYNNDTSLIQACRQALVFYASESERAKAMSDFFLKKEKFDKLKKNFEAKRSSDRTQQDVDEYNNGITEINNAVQQYNKLNVQLNNERTDMLNNWNKKSRRFMDDYMPVQKKQ